MNRFAIIPLALLANACSSQADLEAMAEEAETDIRELLEDQGVATERITLENRRVRERIVTHAVRQFKALTKGQGCTIEAVAIADWQDRSFKYRGMALSLDAKPMAAITGIITYDDNNSGQILGTDSHTLGDIESVEIKGLWMGRHIEADVFVTHTNIINEDELTLFATKKQRGLNGHFIGVLADCN